MPDLNRKTESKQSLVVDNISKTYRAKVSPALQSFCLTLDRGEIFGLLGPNGAGKTTAISIMTALVTPDQGAVFVQGVNLLRSSSRNRQLFGLVPQDIALYEALTARENLHYFGQLYGLRRRALKKKVRDSLELVGLEQNADTRISRFSGGMKRRANLAAGILHTPDLLFLDEPTVGIDAQSRRLILERISELASQGMSIVYTTHYMEEAESICTRVAVLERGEKIVQGSPSGLLEQHRDCQNLGDLFIKLTGKDLRD